MEVVGVRVRVLDDEGLDAHPRRHVARVLGHARCLSLNRRRCRCRVALALLLLRGALGAARAVAPGHLDGRGPS
eukprot:scaffold182891_cov19-Tisochrysis_lutea.AAC.2